MDSNSGDSISKVMRGNVRCARCEHVFQIGHATMSFDFSKAGTSHAEMKCPRCGSDDIVPTYTDNASR